jgi:hypothetical protein
MSLLKTHSKFFSLIRACGTFPYSFSSSGIEFKIVSKVFVWTAAAATFKLIFGFVNLGMFDSESPELCVY